MVRERPCSREAFRTRAEIEATARFSRMADELAEHGATPFVVQGAREAAADEARHRDLCGLLAVKFGAPEALQHVAPRARIGRSDMDPRDRLLWEMVSVCCIGETMNTAVMTRSFEVAKDPEIRSTLHELLTDEVRHARLGWAHLAAERAAGRGAFLRDVLLLQLEASIEPEFLEGKGFPAWNDALYDFGELPWSELLQIYRDTLNLVVFRGLDEFGIDTSLGRTWLEEHVRHVP